MHPGLVPSTRKKQNKSKTKRYTHTHTNLSTLLKKGGGGFNPRTQEAEANWFLGSRPTWSTKRVPEQLGYSEKYCFEKPKKN